MQEIDEQKRKGRMLVQGYDGDVYGLAAHPFLPMFAVGTREGQLQLWCLHTLHDVAPAQPLVHDLISPLAFSLLPRLQCTHTRHEVELGCEFGVGWV